MVSSSLNLSVDVISNKNKSNCKLYSLTTLAIIIIEVRVQCEFN